MAESIQRLVELDMLKCMPLDTALNGCLDKIKELSDDNKRMKLLFLKTVNWFEYAIDESGNVAPMHCDSDEVDGIEGEALLMLLVKELPEETEDE